MFVIFPCGTPQKRNYVTLVNQDISVYLSVFVFDCLSVCLYVYQLVRPYTWQAGSQLASPLHTHHCLPLCNAIQRMWMTTTATTRKQISLHRTECRTRSFSFIFQQTKKKENISNICYCDKMEFYMYTGFSVGVMWLALWLFGDTPVASSGYCLTSHSFIHIHVHRICNGLQTYLHSHNSQIYNFFRLVFLLIFCNRLSQDFG